MHEKTFKQLTSDFKCEQGKHLGSGSVKNINQSLGYGFSVTWLSGIQKDGIETAFGDWLLDIEK